VVRWDDESKATWPYIVVTGIKSSRSLSQTVVVIELNNGVCTGFRIKAIEEKGENKIHNSISEQLTDKSSVF